MKQIKTITVLNNKHNEDILRRNEFNKEEIEKILIGKNDSEI